MTEQIIFTVLAFILFLYILWFKLIKKNDTTYLIVLLEQTIGIAINFVRINFEILNDKTWFVIANILCIIIPIIVCILECIKINVSEKIKLTIARIWLWIDNTKKAKSILQDLVKKYPESLRGHKLLAKIYEKDGGLRKAINEYVNILEIKRNDYEAYYKISVLLNELGQKDDAIEMLKKLINNKPMKEAIKLLGEIYFEQKEYKKAIECYTNHLNRKIDDESIYYNLGICYVKVNDFEEARKAFEKCIEINEELYLAYYRLGQIALLYRDFDVAEEKFKKSLYNEKKAKAYIELAKIHMIKNQKDVAVIDIKNALKIESSLYEMIKREPMFFAIRKSIEKPQQESENEYKESEYEKEIDRYLRDTYNLTKKLNEKNDIR